MMAFTTSMCGMTLWVAVPAGVGMSANWFRSIRSVSMWAMSALSGIFLLLLFLVGSFKGRCEFIHAVGLIAESAVTQDTCDRRMLHAGNRGKGIPKTIGNLPRSCLLFLNVLGERLLASVENNTRGQ